MRVDFNGRELELEPNSRPYLLKRLLADGFDTVLLFALFMLLTMLIMKTPLADDYHAHFENSRAIETATAAELENDAEAVGAALGADELYRSELFAANLHGYLLKALAALIAEGLVLLAVPLLNRDRATPGKLMAGVMPFNEQRRCRAKWYQIFYRFLFVFLFDSLALYLYTGVLTFLLVPLLRLTEMLLNKKHKTLCDYMTGIMIIEKLSYDGIN